MAGNNRISYDKFGLIEYGNAESQTILQGYTLQDLVCIADQANLNGMMGRMAPLCQPDLKFMAIEDIEPDFSFAPNGVIGLAPNAENSLPKALKRSGSLSRATITFHSDKDGKTVLGFGENIAQKSEGVKHFFNLGEDSWSVPLNHIFYDYDHVMPEEFSKIESFVPTRLAHIDSVNASIQIGQPEFEVIQKKMQQQDKTIEAKLVQNNPPRYSLYSKMKCEIVKELLSDIQF